MIKEIGQVIKMYREDNGLSQSQLAKKLGSLGFHGYISRIETGKEAPTIEYIEKILNVLGKSTKEFLLDLVKIIN